MNKAITYGTMMAATITLLACQRNGGELGEADRTVQILSTVSYDKMSKGLVAQATPLTSVRFLQVNGTAVPTSMTGSTPFEGNRAADGSIAWTGTAPTYNKEYKNSYFVAYHPAMDAGAVETADTKVDWTVDGKTDLLLSAPYDAGKYSAPKTGSNAGETPLTFHHVLAQLQVVFQAEAGFDLARVQALYGKITGVKLAQSLPTATYTYATNKTTFSGTKADIALWQADCETTFAPIAVPASGNKTVNAAGLVAPSTGVFALIVSTENYAPLSIPVQLSSAGANKDLATGLRHTVTVQLNSDEAAVVLNTSVAAWTNTTVPHEDFGRGPWLLMLYGEAPFSVAAAPLVGSTTSSYNGYTGTVADGKNGAYQATRTDAYKNEMPYYRLEVAMADESGGGKVNLAAARSLCAAKITDGGGWRLPRISELQWIYQNKAKLDAVLGFTAFQALFYHSATELDNSKTWFCAGNNGNLDPDVSTYNGPVRCVREW